MSSGPSGGWRARRKRSRPSWAMRQPAPLVAFRLSQRRDRGRRPGARARIPRPARLHTKGWLPYTLRWTLTVTEPITARGFALIAAGDLNGTGRWTFEPDGPETVITYDWRVNAAKPLLRRLSWLLKPGFAANHRWAMARGQESLALELRRRRAARGNLGAQGGRAAAIPPPPPPTFAWLTRLAARRTRDGRQASGILPGNSRPAELPPWTPAQQKSGVSFT